METSIILIPFALLFDPDLTAAAKLTWMLQAAARSITTRTINPSSDSGLFRHTVRRASQQLVAAGWSTHVPVSPGKAALVPVHLLLDRRLGAQARVLYAMLQAVPKFCADDQTGRFTYTALSQLTRAGINTLKRSLLQLKEAEWVQTCQRRTRAPIDFVLANPAAVAAEAWVTNAQWRIKRAEHKGEAIMQEYLTLLIDSTEYQDNVKSGVLINPWSGERMEFDRYYPDVAAFEFQGSHHDGSTDQFTEKEVRSQQARDLMKMGICAKKGIALVEVRRAELSLNVMKQKVGTLLPLRDLTGLEKVVRYLEAVARSYRG